MDTDLVLTGGVVILALSLPALLSARAESRLSKLGTAMFVVAAGMIGWAIYANPGGYQLAEIPDAVLGVLARVLN